MSLLTQIKSQRRRIAMVFAIIFLTIGLDQVTKSMAKQTLRMQGPIDYLGGIFKLEYAENPGAFLGLGSGLSPELRFWIFVVLVAGFLIYAAYALVHMKDDLYQAGGLAFLLAGGLGNLWDRVVYHQVIDFMNLGIGSLRTGIFNVADFAIVIGLCLMLFSPTALAKPRRKAQADLSSDPAKDYNKKS